MSIEEKDLLRRHLYVFELPEKLISSIVLKEDREVPPSLPETAEISAPTPTPTRDGEGTTSTSCGLCGTSSKTVADQRAHVRSDLHRFNLKRKILGQVPVSGDEFERMLEGLSESISGSDDSDSESSGDDTDPLSMLLKKKARLSDEPSLQVSSKRVVGPGKAPLIWYSSPLLPSTVSLGVYRALFSNMEQGSDYLSALRSAQISPNPKAKPPHIVMCMIGGGHFAAMVVSLASKTGKGQGTGSGDREVVVLAHKTFHRYTTRRKQGGAQSANDAAKGNAHSAGSSLRRHNEAMLTNEVRELLGSWKEPLDTAKSIFVRATGTANRKTLFGYEGAPLRSNDPRIRGFPFTTRRATQSELMRCFVELMRVKVSRIDENALAALNEESKKSSEASAKAPKPITPKISKEEEALILHSTQLHALIRRSKAPAVLSYLTTNSLSSNFQFHPPNHHSPTLLHLAASSNSPAVVLALLTKAGSDPSYTSQEQAKVAFELAGDRPTRDAFRVARTELGEKKWDWAKSKVPSGLTREQADERDRKEKEGSEQEEKARRRREMQRLKELEPKAPAAKAGRTVGSSVMMGMSKREEEEKGLSPEAKMRLDRERRARAAEERIKKMQGGR